MAADRPFTRQYDLFAGGLNGVPAALLPLTVLQTNENYMVVRNMPFAFLFSRGGFLTNASQAGKHEKILMAVFLVPVKVCTHPAGIAGVNVQAMLDGEGFRKVGHVAALRWGQTFTFQTAARPQKLTLRAELCASVDVAEEGEEPDLVPEAPDSPPPFQRRVPVNFY